MSVRLIPENLRIAEIPCLRDKDRISFIFCEGIPTVCTVCEALALGISPLCRLRRSIYGHNRIFSETGGIVVVDYT